MGKWLAAVVLALGVSVLVSGQTPPPVPPRVTAVIGGTIVDVRGGTPTPDAVILIDKDRIAAIGPASNTKVPPGAEVIAADGKWRCPA
jgi:imidazolonepropionase-like amidohydrolase